MNEVRCCGLERDSLFCPDCGKKLHAEPIMDLRSYLQQMIRMQVGSLAKATNPVVNLRKQRTLEKWQGWLAALERILVEQGQKVHLTPGMPK